MATTAIDTVLAALLALWKEALNDPPFSTITVCDAEDDWLSDMKTCVIVGVRYDIDKGELIGEVDGEQTFPNISTRSKDERLTIPHSIIAWSGDSKAATRRAQALELWRRLAAFHRDNNALQITEPGVTVLGTNFGSQFSLRYLKTDNGNAAVLTWDVTATTRLSHD